MGARRFAWLWLGGGVVLTVVGLVGFFTSGGGGETEASAAEEAPATEASTPTTAAPTPTPELPTPTPVPPTAEPPPPTAVPPTPTAEPPTAPAEPPTPIPVVEESAEDFIAQLQASLVLGGDRTFAVERLGQATIDRYGRDACDTTFEALAEDFQIAFREVAAELDTWDYVTDDVTTTLTDVTQIEIDRLVDGQTLVQVLHVTRANDGTFRWYSDCGDPL